MKTMIFLLSLISATISQAAPQPAAQILYCDGGHQAFTATLEATSDYFSLTDAKITGAFVHTNFICAGNKLITGVKCAGFWNDKSNQHLEVSFAQVGDQLIMAQKSLASGNVENWVCSVEPGIR